MMKTFAHEMALILFASSALFSQQAPPEAKMDRGLSLTTTYTESNDSSLGWSTELSFGLEYDISKQWNVSAGIPVYLVQPYSTGIRKQRLKTSYNSMGDFSTTINYNTGLGPIDYATSLTGTAPTGDVTDGASTGQATFNWNNHFEHDIAWITPFIEAGLGNTTPNVSAPLSVRRLAARSHLPYNTLGMLSNYKAGSDFNCGKNLTSNSRATMFCRLEIRRSSVAVFLGV